MAMFKASWRASGCTTPFPCPGCSAAYYDTLPESGVLDNMYAWCTDAKKPGNSRESDCCGSVGCGASLACTKLTIFATPVPTIKFDTIITLTKADVDDVPTLLATIRSEASLMTARPEMLVKAFEQEQRKAQLALIQPTITSPTPAPTPAHVNSNHKFGGGALAAAVLAAVVVVGGAVGIVVLRRRHQHRGQAEHTQTTRAAEVSGENPGVSAATIDSHNAL
jgi:hypothetical protein